MAAVLLFQSGLIDERTTNAFDGATMYLGAAVGMSASVAPNELNSITAELTRQQQLLASREQALVEREIAVQRNPDRSSDVSMRTTYFLAAILFIQLVLIILNYGLDFLRAREREMLRFENTTSG